MVAAAQDYDTCKLRLSDELGLKECEAVSYMELFLLPAGGGGVVCEHVMGLFLLNVFPVQFYLSFCFSVQSVLLLMHIYQMISQRRSRDLYV